MQPAMYPVQFEASYPDRPLNRLTTFFRLFTAIPIVFVLTTVSGEAWHMTSAKDGAVVVAGAGGLLFLGPLLAILFRQKYPRWWFNWNLELSRFANRVWVYLLLMNDHYPSLDDQQSVRLDFPYPDAPRELNRWLPLVKWLLAIPHYFALLFLYIAAFAVVIAAWFAILFTGRYPQGLYRFVEGVIRWQNRVAAYAFLLVTDRYPPFSLEP
jgi:hypothetical protein